LVRHKTKPIFISGIDACATLGIELQKVDVMVQRQQSPLMTKAGYQIITTFWDLRMGAGAERIRAAIRQVIEYEGLFDYESIHTDGSLKEEKLGCAVFLAIAIPIAPQTTIFNGEMFANLKTTEHSKHMHCKTVIIFTQIHSAA
jgi:hypothetical protein